MWEPSVLSTDSGCVRTSGWEPWRAGPLQTHLQSKGHVGCVLLCYQPASPWLCNRHTTSQPVRERRTQPASPRRGAVGRKWTRLRCERDGWSGAALFTGLAQLPLNGSHRHSLPQHVALCSSVHAPHAGCALHPPPPTGALLCCRCSPSLMLFFSPLSHCLTPSPPQCL